MGLPQKKEVNSGKNEDVLPPDVDLFIAAESGDLDGLVAALNHRDINSIDEELGMSALHFAVRGLALRAVKFLLDRDIDISIEDRLGRDAVSFAMEVWQAGGLEIAELISKKRFEELHPTGQSFDTPTNR